MTEELRAYYALKLWAEYLEAKARADHAHEDWTDGGENLSDAVLHTACEVWRGLDNERRAILAKLRATPEHKAAFGW